VRGYLPRRAAARAAGRDITGDQRNRADAGEEQREGAAGTQSGSPLS
jgi:hypothetical protein